MKSAFYVAHRVREGERQEGCGQAGAQSWSHVSPQLIRFSFPTFRTGRSMRHVLNWLSEPSQEEELQPDKLLQESLPVKLVLLGVGGQTHWECHLSR